MSDKKYMKRSILVKTDIKIKLIPGSSKNQFVGKEDDLYRVKVTAPPVDGKANRALISLLSKKLGRPKGSIEIISGESSRIKQIRVHGVSGEEVNNLLQDELP
jgi:uncharacterized protein (TIGR00251 family)